MVSIIIPNYNHSAYLHERIESVLNQTYQDWELIILDDCSTDNSAEVIKNYSHHDKISHIIINTDNSGSTFKQWAKGISLAQGEYIWIAESDDVADCDFLSSIMDGLCKHGDAGIGFSDSYLIDENSNVLPTDLDKMYDKHNGAVYLSVEDSYTFIKSQMLFSNRIYNASAVVFKKSLWEKIEKHFLDLKLCGDWICWLSILTATKQIVHVHRKLNHFRQHLNKVTSKSVLNGNAYRERRCVVNFISHSFPTLSSFTKNALIGKSVHLIQQSDLSHDIKNEIYREWDLSYASRQISFMTFVIYKGIKLLF